MIKIICGNCLICEINLLSYQEFIVIFVKDVYKAIMPFRVPSVEKILDQYYGDIGGPTRGDSSSKRRRSAEDGR